MTHPTENQSQPVRKCFAVEAKAASIKENEFSGAAAVIGNMDYGGDVIFPGFFKGVLPAFLKTGFVTPDHNWSFEAMCAMPKSAKEQGRELSCVAKYHTDARSQDIRLKMSERLAEGLSVGLSIGFGVDYTGENGRIWFENGKALAKYIEEQGLDQALFDMPGIKRYPNWCRGLLKCETLYEFGPVVAPMNGLAGANNVKSISLEDLNSLNELSFEDHSHSVLTAVKGYLARVQDYSSMREGKGRPLSSARIADFSAVKTALDSLLDKAGQPAIDPDIDLLRLQVEAESLAIDSGLIGL